MADPNEVSHPTLKQFKSALDTKKAGRALTEAFDRWRQSPKCAPGSELKDAADALWARFQTEMAGQPAPPSTAARNPTPKPVDKRSQRRDSGPGRGR